MALRAIKKLLCGIIFLGLSFLYPGECFSDGITSPGGTNPFISYMPAEGVKIEPLDLIIKLAGTFVLQQTPNPNKSDSSAWGTSWVGYLDFKKKFADSGLLFLRIEPGIGDTVASKLNLLTGINYNAHDNGARPEVRQFWYEQQLFDRQVSLTAGKIESRNYLDKSEYAGDDDRQFLADIFNKPYAVEWPTKYGFGLHVNICPKKTAPFEFAFNYFDAAAKWSELWSNNMYTLEAKFKARGGNYRLYSWLNTRKHQMLLKQEEKHLNYGAGVGFDQPIADIFGIFGRFSWQRPDLAPVDGGPTLEFAWSAGAQMTGRFWRREDDILALAAGQVFPSKEYHEAGHPGSGEGHVELYYSLALGKYIHISPDFQMIWNPDGVGKASEGDDDTIFVYGIRMRLDF